jgi:broad specificity polyphosphatase/5'/3'-nucleotidase SurE
MTTRKKSKPLILVTNDDGVTAPGIVLLLLLHPIARNPEWGTP